MRSEVWIKFCLFLGSVLADSEELEDYEARIPCVPVGYKCYTTDDCCAGAACVAAKWSSHLVCLVAGYKEDIKLDRIGRKKEIQQQDLDYLKNMYGFSVDSWGRIRDFETILDPLYSSTPRPITEKNHKVSDDILPRRTNSIETFFEILFNSGTTSFTSRDYTTTTSTVKLPNSFYTLRRDQSVIFDQEENDRVKENYLPRSENSINVVGNAEHFDQVITAENRSDNEEDFRMKRNVNLEFYSDNLEGDEESQYSDSYSDPFGSYIDNTDRATLIDNITTQIEQTEIEFKPLSYNSLETLLQNLTGFELTLPNFTWPFTYNESTTVLSPVEPVTIPERLWNLANNGSRDYSELDFGETYDMLKGNYSNDWFMGESIRGADSINFNLTSVNKFLNGLGLGFFKDKNGSSSWKKILKFVHSDKKNFTDAVYLNRSIVVRVKNTPSNNDKKNLTDAVYLNRSIVVRVKNTPSNKSTWRMITGFFRNDGDETIKFNLIPRNVSGSNSTFVSLIGDFNDCGLSANVSCLLWSILNSNGSQFVRKSGRSGEGVRSRLWREIAEEVRKNRIKKSHFVDVVRLVNRKRRTKGRDSDILSENTTETGNRRENTGTFNTMDKKNVSEENEKWWSKVKQVFKKVDKNISKSEVNFDVRSSIFNTSGDRQFLENSFESFSEKMNLTENSSLWKKIKKVFKMSSKSEATTSGTDASDFMKRYMAWSGGHRKTYSYDSPDTTTASPTDYLGFYFNEIRSKSTYGNIFK